MKRACLVLMLAALPLMACVPAEAPEPDAAVASAPEAPAVADAGAAPAAWKARGNEPGWILSIADGRLDFAYDYGEGNFETAAPQAETLEAGRRYVADEGAFVATVTDAICFDDMTGMPYPSAVTVQYTDRQFTGCGGEPAELLAGGTWVVEDINGQGVVDDSRLTLVFDTAESHVSGQSGCNTYGAPYTIGGEGIRFGPVVSTEMACAEALMTQESAFGAVLANVSLFAINESGALVLSGATGEQITARRAD